MGAAYALARREWFVYHRTMDAGPDIARVAALIGDRARADMLTALLGEQALTATELANIAGVTKQTVSAHLAKLRAADLVAVESQGRHRYFRLADRGVARLLESLMGVAQRSGAAVMTGPRDLALRKARVCYDHLAGEFGVLVHDSLCRQRHLRASGDALSVTPSGRDFLGAFGIDVETLGRQRRPLCRACLDWSVRRHHLAGALGAALLDRMFALGWARRARNSRAVNFTVHGERALHDQFR
jgi:DNA-binding transcriptional ArsR family regulator